MNLTVLLSRTLLLIIALVSIGATAEAQIMDRIRSRVEYRANQRINQEVDRQVDNAIDSILVGSNNTATTEESSSSAATDTMPAPNRGFGGISFGGKFEPYENPVKLNVSMDIVTTNQRGKEDHATMHLTFDTWQTGLRMVGDEGETTRVILDNKDGYMTMITNDKGKEEGIKMRQMVIDYDKMVEEQTSSPSFTVEATGKTRVIDGYNCTEYLITHDEGTTSTWVTRDVDIDFMSISRAMIAQSRGANKNMTPAGYPTDAFPIESIHTAKNGKETTTTRFYDIRTGGNVDMSVFNTTGVNITTVAF